MKNKVMITRGNLGNSKIKEINGFILLHKKKYL